MDQVLMIAIAAVAVAVAFVVGRRMGRAPVAAPERRLEEYPFYPFVVDEERQVVFDPDRFSEAVRHFLDHRNHRAGSELIVIGEQNLVRDTLPSDRLREYQRFYDAYRGDAVVADNEAFLENYRRIVHHLGRSFPNTGVEILLHNLVNPSRSLVAIENAAVTGRSVGSGTTNLVFDLKTRRQRGEDKINYELNIGSRRFKCTTIPIFRPDYGLVGAICINIDERFLREHVVPDPERLTAFFDNLLRTDFSLDENILSKDEYRLAMRGKRHYLDEAIRSVGERRSEHRLAAIMFSDIVGYTSQMGQDEAATMRIVEANEGIHRRALARHGGRLLKRLGDGMLAAFDSASEAVAGAREIQREVATAGGFQLRVGIHLGEVVDDGSDVYGDGVNIARRIQESAEAGEIGISAAVYDNVRNKPGLEVGERREVTLKGVAEPVGLYLVEP